MLSYALHYRICKLKKGLIFMRFSNKVWYEKHLEQRNLRSSSGCYFFHAVIQHICGIFCFREASWDDSKFFSESFKMMIRFPCQKVIILEEFTYFQIALTIHSFQESCAPILFFKNFKNSHLSWISNFHALISVHENNSWCPKKSRVNPVGQEVFLSEIAIGEGGLSGTVISREILTVS